MNMNINGVSRMKNDGDNCDNSLTTCVETISHKFLTISWRTKEDEHQNSSNRFREKQATVGRMEIPLWRTAQITKGIRNLWR